MSLYKLIAIQKSDLITYVNNYNQIIFASTLCSARDKIYFSFISYRITPGWNSFFSLQILAISQTTNRSWQKIFVASNYFTSCQIRWKKLALAIDSFSMRYFFVPHRIILPKMHALNDAEFGYPSENKNIHSKRRNCRKLQSMNT